MKYYVFVATLCLAVGGMPAAALSEDVYSEWATYMKAAVKQREEKVYRELDKDLVRHHISTDQTANHQKELGPLAQKQCQKNSPDCPDNFKPDADQSVQDQIQSMTGIAGQLQGFTPGNFLASNYQQVVPNVNSVSFLGNDGPKTGADGKLLASPITLALPISGTTGGEQKTPRKGEHYEYGKDRAEPQADDQYPQPNYQQQECGTHNHAGC